MTARLPQSIMLKLAYCSDGMVMQLLQEVIHAKGEWIRSRLVTGGSFSVTPASDRFDDTGERAQSWFGAGIEGRGPTMRAALLDLASQLAFKGHPIREPELSEIV